MYDYEIANYLQNKNYNITSDDLFYITTTSPQINLVKYDAYNNKFVITTDDRNEFYFEVHHE